MSKPLDVRQVARERAAGANWFRTLPRQAKWDLGDQLVLGEFDWSNWLDSKPSTAFLRGVEEARIVWEDS